MGDTSSLRKPWTRQSPNPFSAVYPTRRVRTQLFYEPSFGTLGSAHRLRRAGFCAWVRRTGFGEPSRPQESVARERVGKAASQKRSEAKAYWFCQAILDESELGKEAAMAGPSLTYEERAWERDILNHMGNARRGVFYRPTKKRKNLFKCDDLPR